MHDVTNQAKKHHERFAKEKTDPFRWYDMSGVKDGNTKIRLQQHIDSDSYRHVVSFCCSKYGKNAKKMARKICFNVQQKFDIFREFHEEVERKTSFTNNIFFDVFCEVSYGKKDEKVGRYAEKDGRLF